MYPTEKKSNGAIMPLTMARSGQTVRLVDVNAGRGLRQRLADMGLVPGTVLRVMSNGYSGPFVVAIREMRVMLGRGMANKILVE